MGIYDGSHVWHAAVADFYRFSVKDFMEFVAGWKMGVNQLKKFLTNVGLYCFAERGVEPDDIPAPCSSSRGRRVVLEHMVMSTSTKGLLVVAFIFLKYGF